MPCISLRELGGWDQELNLAVPMQLSQVRPSTHRNELGWVGLRACIDKLLNSQNTWGKDTLRHICHSTPTPERVHYILEEDEDDILIHHL